jgi:hypothetical protein
LLWLSYDLWFSWLVHTGKEQSWHGWRGGRKTDESVYVTILSKSGSSFFLGFGMGCEEEKAIDYGCEEESL